ncbi:MAG: ribosome small subunit-dependent GTPase A [Bacteroides sp.]|nr:ribosome small subunit-dependent GTPase A [Bacteroides sp.]MCM1447814.1 ribosome small subunit-dependent GTPase A [Bacteroides sp.]MCM1516907.1 ribosome small subunit-dependent GTPase A [Paraprevotella sp.]
MQGVVIKNTGSWYVVRIMDDSRLFRCKVKGNFRLKGIRSTNPVAVGDHVRVLPTETGDESVGMITEILDRRNYIIRKASNLSKQSHIIAANVDLAALVVTLRHPETSTTFIDRFLAGAEAYRVPVIIIFNKVDLLDKDDLRLLKLFFRLYEGLGYPCYGISALHDDIQALHDGDTGQDDGTGLCCISALHRILAGKTTLFSGNSGVGKSTLLNALIPGLDVRTAEISDTHDTGTHTTTFSEMFDLPPLPGTDAPAGHIIDTPGIKGFGTFDMEREEVGHYFREIFDIGRKCRFGNCTHTHEPGCAVLEALEERHIAQSRYHSYLSMLEDKDEDKYRSKL